MVVTKSLKYALFALITIVFCLGGIYTYAGRWLEQQIILSPEQRVFVVNKGESLEKVSLRLAERNILRWPRLWRYYAQYIDKGGVKAGEFRFNTHESPISILDTLQSNQVIHYKITFYEGINYRQMLDLLGSNSVLIQTLANKPWFEQKKILGVAEEHPEGLFFPDTYQFIRGDSDADILQRSYQKMRQTLLSLWPERDVNLPYASSYEALIMASIVEKETGLASERRDIAGVFVRRLNKRMRLQTDPTVIYALGAEYDGNIRKKDLSIDSPYNTYRNFGLPPTPIAMPGREAIYAALHPAPGKSLYFVARGDGSHQFSETLAEHNRAVKNFQLRRRSDYRSSP